jgi:hypothetical protein
MAQNIRDDSRLIHNHAWILLNYSQPLSMMVFLRLSKASW